MASSWVPDAWGWISTLPAVAQWNTNTLSLRIIPSRPPHPPLVLTATKSLQNQNPYIFFSVVADYELPLSLWTSASLSLKNRTQKQPVDEDTASRLFSNIVAGVLQYGPQKGSSSSPRLPSVKADDRFRDVFNLAFFTLVLLVCIYEAPQDLRLGWLDSLRLHLTSPRSRGASKDLVRFMGSNLEEQWMRALNLAITNQIMELQGTYHSFRAPSPLFSYAISASGMWKLQFYCPVAAMGVEDPGAKTADERLLFSLRYQQLEGVVQLAYKLVFRENWIDVIVKVDNIRCDVNPLVSETLMTERGLGPEEKHFPSRVSLQLTPTQLQTYVLSVSVSRSSDNPACEVGHERAIEGSFDPPGTSLGLRLSAAETVTISMRPWKFEQSVYGSSASLHWFLHDGIDGREVCSSRPPKLALFQPRAWFRDRYSSAYRPFTKQGGVVFAGDEYGESVWWKMASGAAGQTMEWEIRGSVWITYWPNKHRSFYSETRRLEFLETVQLPLNHK
ncbi:hypothetical protein Taro_044171 [Colocasia esculenta]|uniref:Uncharacterized protein n=1 Tax=Colocasia esculenta TaxID=4460 RepID=A0A843WN18_COLES|nr:hypothetical protein [Colocasia esculenta]